jgi:hypothetical protein
MSKAGEIGDPIGNLPCDLPACSVVLSRAPIQDFDADV